MSEDSAAAAGEDFAVSKQQQEAVAGRLLVSHLQLQAAEQRDSREENLTWPLGNAAQGSEGREAAMPETCLLAHGAVSVTLPCPGILGL